MTPVTQGKTAATHPTKGSDKNTRQLEIARKVIKKRDSLLRVLAK